MAAATAYVFSPPHKPGLWVSANGVVAPGGSGDPTPPPPPPGGSGLLYGWSVAEGINNLPDPALVSTAGPMTIVRRYRSGPFADTWATDSSGMKNDFAAGRAVMYSCKPNLALLISSSAERARLLAMVRSAPDAAVIIWEAWHELDVKMRKGIAPFDTMSLADINAAKLIFYDIIKQAGKPNHYTMLCLSAFAAWGGVTVGKPEQFWVGASGAGRVIDMVAYDEYQTSNTPPSAASHWAPCYTFASGHGAAVAVGELGIHGGTGNVTDYTTVPAWLQAQLDYLAGHDSGGHTGAAAVLLFNSANQTAQPVPSLTAAIQAKSKTLATAHYLPPTSFRL